MVRQAIVEAQVAYCAALAPLTKSEINELQTYLVPVLCTQNQVGHTLADRGTGRRMCDLMEKMDREALHRGRPGAWPPWPTRGCWSNSSRCRTTATCGSRA